MSRSAPLCRLMGLVLVTYPGQQSLRDASTGIREAAGRQWEYALTYLLHLFCYCFIMGSHILLLFAGETYP